MSEKRKIIERAGIVGGWTLVSRIFGLFRDMVIAFAFGSKEAADAFFVAFRIPNLLRRLFAEGALTISFVPIFTESLKEDREEARRIVRVSFSLAAVVLMLLSLFGILISPWLVRLTAYGFTSNPDKFQLTVFLTRVMFPYIFLVSLAALGMGVLNSLKRFAVPAAAPVLMNLGVIAGALWFSRWIHPPVLGLALGVLAGGLLQLAIHFPPMIRLGFSPSWEWKPRHPAVGKILKMMLPAAYGAAVYQFNVIVITFLASFLPEGSVSYLWYADRLMEFPLGIFGISLATVILPSLSELGKKEDGEVFKEIFRHGLRLVLLITLPAMVGLIVLSRPIIQILFEHGRFTPFATGQTATALVCYAVGLPFISAVRMTSNAFFALHDSRTPVKVANQSVVVNVILCLILMHPLKHNGLALAVSLASVYNLVMQMVHFRRRVGLLGLRKVLQATLKMGGATLLMGGVLLVLLHWVPEGRSLLVNGGRLALLVLVGAGVYFASLWCLQVEEIRKAR